MINDYLVDVQGREPEVFIAGSESGEFYRCMRLPQVLHAIFIHGGLIVGNDFSTEHSLNLGPGDVMFFSRYESARQLVSYPEDRFSDMILRGELELLSESFGIELDVESFQYLKTSFLFATDKRRELFDHQRGYMWSHSGPFPISDFSEESLGHLEQALGKIIIKINHSRHH